MDILNVFFSPNGETRKISDYFASNLPVTTIDITKKDARDSFDFIRNYELVIFSLPSYSQNIPKPLRLFLEKINITYLALNISCGGFSFGKIANDVIKATNSTLISLSLIPVKHAYIDEQFEIDFDILNPIIKKIKNNDLSKIKVPAQRKNAFASFLETTRTRYNYRLSLNVDKCIKCKKCIINCPMQAINDDMSFNSSCISCGACVRVCPTYALTAKKSTVLKRYLKTRKINSAKSYY